MTKKKVTIQEYKVLISCHNNKTGKAYTEGDTVTTKDFSQAVIDNWLACNPPVLEVV